MDPYYNNMNYNGQLPNVWDPRMVNIAGNSGQRFDPSAAAGFGRSNINHVENQPFDERRFLTRDDMHGRKRRVQDTAPSFRSKVRRSSEHRSSTRRSSSNTSRIFNEEADRYADDLIQEQNVLDCLPAFDYERLVCTRRLVGNEIKKLSTRTNTDWLDLEPDVASIRVSKRVLLPQDGKERGKTIGRLLGAGGKSIRKICQTYQCAIELRGKGSSKDRLAREQDLLNSGNPEYSHFALPFHAEVTVCGPAHSAYDRFGKVLSLLHKIINIKERFEHEGIIYDVQPPDFKQREEIVKNTALGQTASNQSNDVLPKQAELQQESSENVKGGEIQTLDSVEMSEYEQLGGDKVIPQQDAIVKQSDLPIPTKSVNATSDEILEQQRDVKLKEVEPFIVTDEQPTHELDNNNLEQPELQDKGSVDNIIEVSNGTKDEVQKLPQGNASGDQQVEKAPSEKTEAHQEKKESGVSQSDQEKDGSDGGCNESVPEEGVPALHQQSERIVPKGRLSKRGGKGMALRGKTRK